MLGGKYVTNLHVYLGFVHCQPGELTLSIMGLKNLHIFNKVFLFLEWKKVVRIWKMNNYSNIQADLTPLTVLYNFQYTEKVSEIRL